ncbi:MAG: methyltransferase family protein [Promethearchaeota archaeon]
MNTNREFIVHKAQPKFEKHSNRADLAATYPKTDLVQVLSFLGFIVVIIADLAFLTIFSPIHDLIPWYIRLIIAAPILIGAGLVSKKGINIVYGNIRDPPCVIESGPFRFSRHPMYLGALLFYLGIIILTFSVIGTIYYVGVIGLYNYLARYEEMHLIQKFGQEYKSYMKKVSRWLGSRF